MENSKLIHEFVDGTLSPDREEELFSMLRTDENLRSELKQQMAIKSAIRGDTKAFTPSATSTMNIFNELGFSTGSAGGAAAGAAAGGAGGIASWFSKYSQGLIGGAIAAAATAAVLLFLTPAMNDSGAEYESKYQAAISEIKQLRNELANTEAPQVTIAEPETAPAIQNSSKPQIIYRTVYVEKEITAGQSGASEDNADAPMPRNNQITMLRDTPVLNVRNASKIDVSYPLLDRSPIPVGITSDNRLWDLRTGSELGLSLEVGGNSPLMFEDERTVPDYFRKFNNTNLALMYEFSDEFRAGVEYRRENFYQIYDGTDSEGIGYTVEQQPNFDSFGFAMRYSPEFVSYGIFYPFAQISAGANQAGPVGRIMLGTEIAFNPAYSFIMGGELSGLAFKHQDHLFTSGKGGIYFGASFNF
jgi:hypothetical protein